MKSFNDIIEAQLRYEKWDHKIFRKVFKWMRNPAGRRLPTFADIISKEEWDAMAVTRDEVLDDWYDTWSNMSHEWSDVGYYEIPTPVWRTVENFFIDACRNLNVIKLNMSKGGSYLLRDIKNDGEYVLYICEHGYGSPMYKAKFGEGGMIWGGDDIAIEINEIASIETW